MVLGAEHDGLSSTLRIHVVEGHLAPSDRYMLVRAQMHAKINVIFFFN